MQRSRNVSAIADYEMNLNLLVMYEVVNPKSNPMAVDIINSVTNCHKTTKGVVAVKLSFESNSNLPIVSKRMMATASLASPSPSIIEKSLGNSSNLTIVMAAIISELVNKEDEKRISTAPNLSGLVSPAWIVPSVLATG